MVAQVSLGPMRFSVNQAFSFFLALLAGCLFFAPLTHAATSTFPNDPLYDRQWYLRQINAPDAWSVTKGSQAVTVALIDSGIDFEHPDLAHIHVVDGWNFVSNTSDTRPMVGPFQDDDAMSHGTIMASLLAAQGNNGIGMAGVVWNVSIMPLVVLDMNGFGSVNNIAAAVRYATAHHADIISISVVGYEPSVELDRALKEASDTGILVVAAAGNTSGWSDGLDLDYTPMYPACSLAGSKTVLTVSGTDALDQKAPYANFGYTCVAMSAPGFEMIGAHPFHGAAHDASSTEYVTGVIGTSAAVPLVSGAAALIKSLRPDWKAEQIRARLIATVDPIDPIQSEDVRYRLGKGRLNVGRAVQGLVASKSAPDTKPLFNVVHTLISIFRP